MLCYVTPLEAARKDKERITRLQGQEIWRRQKDENRAKMIREKREVRDLLENYWPWGRPGGGAPNSESVGLKNIHLEGLYANEDMKKAKRFAGVFQFGRPGGGAPQFTRNGRRQVGFKEDPALRFQWGADLRRTVDNNLRYQCRREDQEQYKKDLDALVAEKQRSRDQQLKQKLDFERQMILRTPPWGKPGPGGSIWRQPKSLGVNFLKSMVGTALATSRVIDSKILWIDVAYRE